MAARRFMAAEGDTTPLTNLVFMGMGEPLHNTAAVSESIDIMCCHLGLHMSHNKVRGGTWMCGVHAVTALLLGA